MLHTNKYAFIARAIIPSLFFNFKYLPLKQALKLPILVYKPHFKKLKGKIRIDCPTIRTGMIRLGVYSTAVFPNNGFYLTHEGLITFKGKCSIGNDCYIVCGKNGRIVFGDNFRATAGMKIVSQYDIEFGMNCLIGWSSIVIDTNFHPLFDMDNKKFKKGFGKIILGDGNWLASECIVLPGVITSKDCSFGARSVLTKNLHYESYCVYGGTPLKILSRNVKRISGKNNIQDYSDNEYKI